MTMGEVVPLVGVCRGTIANWAEAGLIDCAFRTRGRTGLWRFKRAEMLEWIKQHQVGGITIPRRRKFSKKVIPKGSLRASLRSAARAIA